MFKACASLTPRRTALPLVVASCSLFLSREAHGQCSERTLLRFADSVVASNAPTLSLPGVAVVVVRGGRLVLLKGYGTRDIAHPDARVAITTPFNIASLTKPFTATVVLQLVREGRIAHDAPVRTYLDWFPQQFAPITVRQLLTHTSGVVRDVRESNEDDPTASVYQARIREAPPAAAPGERYEYSNVGFTLLGWIVEAVERAPLDSVFRMRLFRPLQMSQAAYRAPLQADASRAKPHNVVDGKPQPVAYVSGGFGGGGLSLSIGDLAKFAVAIQRQSLLPAAWQDSAWASVRLVNGRPSSTQMFGQAAAYGFGWFVAKYRERRAVTHSGGINGYSSMLLHFPDDALSIGVLSNARAPVEPIVRALADRCVATTVSQPLSISGRRRQ